MVKESVRDSDITPVCIYFSQGKCLFKRGVDIPSLAQFGGQTHLSDQGKLFDPSLRKEMFCGGRLHFGTYRGVFQENNCNKYASSEPEIKFMY